MLKFFTKHFKNKKGFTLVELIVVIAILGVLAMMAVPRMGSFRSDAAKSTNNANVRTLESAATMYLAEYGVPSGQIKWKPDAGGEVSEITGDLDNSTDEIKKNMWAKYMAEWPKIPKGLNGLKDKDGTEITDNTEYEVTISDKGVVTVVPAQIVD